MKPIESDGPIREGAYYHAPEFGVTIRVDTIIIKGKEFNPYDVGYTFIDPVGQPISAPMLEDYEAAALADKWYEVDPKDLAWWI